MQRERFTLPDAATGVDYPFGVAAAGYVQRLENDVVLTGSLQRIFSFLQEQDVAYDIEATLFLSVSVAGTVTTSVGTTAVTTGTNPIVCMTQTANVGAGSLGATAAGIGPQTLTTTSYSSGAFRSLVLKSSLLHRSASGVLFLDVLTAGTITLTTGSTFKVLRAIRA